MDGVYGKAITRYLTADDGREYLTLPTQTPSIYLFPYGTVPNRTDAAAGTGALQTVSSWTQDPNSKQLTYTYTAVSDPYPTEQVAIRDYWEAVNYVLTASGQVQTKIRQLTIGRAEALPSIPNVTADDVSQVWPNVTSYITSNQLADFIPLAESEMRRTIGSDKWPRLSKLQDAKIVLAYKAIEMMAASQVVKGNADKFIWMVDYFGGKYNSAISQLNFPIDNDGDGATDAIVTTNEAVIISGR
jgi:hypothetical protein